MIARAATAKGGTGQPQLVPHEQQPPRDRLSPGGGQSENWGHTISNFKEQMERGKGWTQNVKYLATISFHHPAPPLQILPLLLAPRAVLASDTALVSDPSRSFNLMREMRFVLRDLGWREERADTFVD